MTKASKGLDLKKIEKGVQLIIDSLGDNINKEGMKETPKRVALMYEEIFSGLFKDVKKEIKLIETKNQDEMIVLRYIPFFSMCEHHLLPFFGYVHIAYIPSNNKITGFSNLLEVVDTLSKRPQIQERMTTDIADTLNKLLKPMGLLVIVEAQQMCLYMRGIKKPGVYTTTSAIRGVMKKSITREEALNLIKAGESR
ncbi:MAG: GTP cyclohydrolase I FolE [bacterium]|uniref:GTP cyclohydrolase 1 n=2 Tax=Bacteria candidate phyla TaxID=1783234 RepID=A0A101I2R1_UNCT6|nr:MAG: GTP cyclohydrolase 1 [candidate division TA06 bacterium 32_111]KUK86790.1 MAG: GTP cyclohydrolase 1 [candidate division TA06 bacterium 34_109]MDI6700240.1 GTP cyclohydrolase I FolE [bacterium]HAF08351.1 GTP cyclohydrolase I FolE [candidate division WOR-3 bacterium]HCP16580.1 GTP cyclohydrolase I FolE [candidate division WOR-3 bacterium]